MMNIFHGMSRVLASASICVILLLLNESTYAQSVLTLEEAVEKTLSYSQIVKVAKNRTEASISAEKATKTNMLPSLDLGGAYNYNLNPATMVLPGAGEEFSIQFEHMASAGLSVSQPIYMGGRLKKQYQIAQIESQMALLGQDVATEDIKLMASYKYWEVVAKKELYKQAQAYERLYVRLVEDITNKFNEGIVNKNDLLMSQTQLSQAEYQTIVAENDYRLTVMELNKLMGVSLTQRTQVIDTVAFDEREIVESNVEGRAIQNREELKIIKADLNIAQEEEKLIKGDYLPQLYAVWNTSYAYPGQFRYIQDTGPAETDPSFLNNLSVGLNMPIYRFSQKKHRMEVQKIVQENIQLQLEQEEDEISLEAQQSYYNYTEAFRKVKVAAFYVESAEENLRLTQENYNEGIVPILDLIESQKAWQISFSEYISSKAMFQTNKLLFLRAVGEL